MGASVTFLESQKAQIVSLASYNTAFLEQTYIRWCCIDRLNRHGLPVRFTRQNLLWRLPRLPGPLHFQPLLEVQSWTAKGTSSVEYLRSIS